MNPLPVNTAIQFESRQPTTAEILAYAASRKDKWFSPRTAPRKSEEAIEAPKVAMIAESPPPARMWTEQQDSHVRDYREAKGNRPKFFLRTKCLEIGVSFEEMISTRRSRRREVVKMRQYLMCEVKKAFPDLSLPAIGTLFGGFDHTTVLNSLRKGDLDLDEINRLKRTPQSLSPSIYRMLQAGRTYAEISAELNISRSSIGAIVRAQGWQWARNTIRVANFSDEIISRALSGECASEIARQLGLSRHSVLTFARNAGVIRPAVKRLASSYADTIRAMMLDGKCDREIGEAVGLGRSSIGKFIRRMGWKR